jgi:hypothetical protein
MRVQQEYLGGALVAYLNCVIIIWAGLHFLKRDPVIGMLPAIAMPLFLFAWPASCLFFAIKQTPSGYGTIYNIYSHLQGFLRVQLAMLVFLAGYLPLVMLCYHRAPVESGSPIHRPRRAVILVTILVLAIIVAYDASRLISFWSQGGLQWWTWGLFNYANGLMLVSGALVLYLPRLSLIFLLVFFAGHLFIYAVGNARLAGLLPPMYMFAGILFFSKLTQKRKTLSLVMLLVAIPLYVWVGNTTRTVMNTVGFENFAQRVQVLLQGPPEDISGGGGAATATMGRMFMTGGHNIIVRTPEEVPYFEFEPLRYAQEMAVSLIPGALYFEPWYRSNWHLRRYGFYLEGTSIEISMLGHFWMMGGWLAAFLGGLAVGCVHCGGMELVRLARRQSWLKALIYTSILATMYFNTAGAEFPSFFRSVVWAWMLAFLVYQAVRIVVPQAEPAPMGLVLAGPEERSLDYGQENPKS